MAPSAKKKALRRAAMSDPGLCDDATSATSAVTGMVSLSDWGISEGSDSDMSPFEAAVEALYEKRASTREAGLEALTTFLACTYSFEQVLDKRETLASLLLNSLRRGSAGEVVLAARCLGLMAVNLGAGDEAEELLVRAQPILVRTTKGSKASAVRVGAIEALALMTFIASDDPATTADVMQTLETLRGAAPAVAAAALRGWSLLLTTQPGSHAGTNGAESQQLESHLTGLGRALDAEDVAVRQAAGEGAALLYSQSGLGDQRDSPPDSGPASPAPEEEAAANGTSSTALSAAEMDSVVARMKDLATHRGDAKRRSKRDRSALKSTFRDLVSTVEDGKVAQTKVRLANGDVLTVDSLAGLVQLNAIRRFLAEGFQAHLQANPLLHQVFHFQPSASPSGAEEGLSRGELRRLLHSPNSASSKAATRRRATARADSVLRKGASYSQLDEGIW